MTAPALPPRALLVALGVPVLVVTVGLLLVSLLAPELPDPVATHWGLDGVDGTGPLWSIPVLLVACGLGIPGLLLATLAVANGREGFTVTAKLLATVAATVPVFLVAVVTGSIVIQRGLDDALEAGSIAPVVGIAALAAALVGGAGWLALPRAAASAAPAPVPAEPLETAPGERLAWVGATSVSRGVLILLALVVALSFAGVLVAVVMSAGALAALLAIPLALLVLVVTTTRFALRADRRGLTVTGALGVPRLRVPLARIARVSVVTVRPFAEFGGIGLRLSPDGRFGVVLREGAALELERHGARPLVVSCEDAETAARVLATLQARAEAPRGRDPRG